MGLQFYLSHRRKVPHTNEEEDIKRKQVEFFYEECINFIAKMPTKIATLTKKSKQKTNSLLSKDGKN